MMQSPCYPDQIVSARWLIRNHKDSVLCSHGLAVAKGQIIEIAPLDVLKDKYPTVKIVGGDRFALLPGFVNAHHHSFGVSSILRGVPDQVLEPWIVEMSGAPSLPKGLAAKLAAAALLRSGVTTTVDMCGGVGTIDEFADGIGETAKGYRESGIKTILAPGMRAQNLLSQADGEDAQFMATLPDGLQDLATAMICTERPAVRDYIACVSEFVSHFNDQKMTEVWFGPPGPQWCGMDAFAEIVEAAETQNTYIQTHVLESFSEKLESRCSLKKSRVQALADEGLLSSRLSLAHMVWASDRDIEAVAEHGVSISHNPSSNLRLRAGIAPLHEFLEAGITVGLGLDGTSLNDDDDMFAEIRLATALHNARVDTKADLSHAAGFRLATQGGAQMIGKSGQVGELAVGASADLVLVDLERLEWPWVDPNLDPLNLILARAKRDDVTSVMVEGRWRLWDKQLADLDLAQLGLEAAEQLAASLPTNERRSQTKKLAKAVHVWHEVWGQNDIEGRATYNTRH
jgi:cytosine/adenosine deaminase-related metal-dependent hydrolase